MSKTLGLDLGTNSIGWAVVDEKKIKIIDAGVRIFPEGVENIAEGKKEKSKNATRRENRQLRKLYFRKKLRKYKLLQLLITLNMCPLNEEDLKKWRYWQKGKSKEDQRKFPLTDEFVEWLKMNPYYLRNKALNANLNLEEFGRILYHFIQRRGFLSSRKNLSEGKIYEGKDNMVGINDTKEKLEDKTLGEFLHSIYPTPNETYKDITDNDGNPMRIRARYTLRKMYIEEFNEIWKRQANQLGLTDKKANKEKARILKGNLQTNRNKSKIKHLQRIYGKENVIINEISKNQQNKKIYEVKTIKEVSLKEFLVGKIEISGNKLMFRSNESLLFWQRPLRSQNYLLSKCRFEKEIMDEDGKWVQKGKKPCPISHPLFEEFRAYQFINNIEYGVKERLDEYQRIKVLELINNKSKNFKFKEIPKLLNLEHETFNYDNEQSIVCNYTNSNLRQLFANNVWEKSKEEIWHNFYFYDDNKKLTEKIITYGTKIKDVDALFDKIKKIKIKEGYSNVSLKAINNILPFLRKGYKYNCAVLLGGIKNAFGKIDNNGNEDRWNRFEEYHSEIEDFIKKILKEDNKEGEVIEKIKKFLVKSNFGFVEDDLKFAKLYHHSQENEKKEIKNKISSIENLRNPIVQASLNELRRLVNSLIKEHGSFDKINVEFGRNLKNNKSSRYEINQKINENQEKNQKAKEILNEHGLSHSRENIQKVLLYNEISNKAGIVKCPYTNKTINIYDLLGHENKVQIEHIIPRSISLDDSFANKTLCDAYFNNKKGESTPREFYKLNNDRNLWNATSWDEVQERVFSLLPYQKAKRFCSKKEYNKNTFIDRQLNDTRYISKKAKEILSEVCSNINILPGSLTSELRHLWGLNNILQPTVNIPIEVEAQEDFSIPYYIVLDENNNVIDAQKKYNNKPSVESNETTIFGNVKGEVFNSTEKYLKLETNAKDYEDGRYWVKLKLSNPKKIVKVYKEKPSCKKDQIVLKGKIEKGIFDNKNLGKIKVGDNDDGYYWAKLGIKDVYYENAEKKRIPKKATNQILLYGNIKDGIFESYIYKCLTNQPDGKYWVKIDLDFEKVSYYKVFNEKPNIGDRQILIEGIANENGDFVSNSDKDFRININKEQGKYWILFDILSDANEFCKYENDSPSIAKDNKLIEGKIWVDKYTGEIKFDPKKNREDHRHHAIDALAIALSKQSYFQKLSTRNAHIEERKRNREHQEEQLVFPLPWDNFVEDAKDAADRILVSFRNKNEITKEIRKNIYKEGNTYLSKGISVKGQLHKEFLYGKRKPQLKKTGFHIRKELKDIRTDKQIKKIVDDKIREIIYRDREKEQYIDKELNKLSKIAGKEKDEKVISEISKKQLWLLKEKELLYHLPNKNGAPVPIKKVRIKEEIGNAEILYKDINKYVNPRNNHHVLIYRNFEGEYKEDVVTFWEAVERRKQQNPLYQLPSEDSNGRIVAVLQKNDTFLLGLDNELIKTSYDYKLISKHLYKVEAVSSKYYEFRHHLESTQNREYMPYYITIRGFGEGITGWLRYNPIKIFISNTGKILEVKY